MNEPMCGNSVNPLSEVDNEISFCNSRNEELESVVILLNEKLSPILRRDTCTSISDGKDSVEITPLANSIRVIGQKTATQIEKIREIIGKLAI
jgi:hypothetical protein